MPRKALRCLVDLTVHAITCPGVWLPRRDDVYVCVKLFGQTRRTQLTSPVFPLLFHERFKFDQVFYTAFEPSQVADSLEDEPIVIEVLQYSDVYQGGKLLAYYEGNAKQFLYPYPSYSSTYGTQDRDILLETSLDFPGISPKLEFSTKTTIKETQAPLLDYDGDYQDEDAPIYMPHAPTSGRYSSLSAAYSPRSPRQRRYRSPSRREGGYRNETISSISRCRSVSPSVRRRMEELNLEDSVGDIKPPFVVRKVDSNKLIGRKPASRSVRCRHGSGGTSLIGRRSLTSGAYPSYDDTFMYGYTSQPDYRYTKVVREPLEESYNGYGRTRGYYTDDDILTTRYDPARYKSSYDTYRPRTSLRDRFEENPWSLSHSDVISSRVDRALRRNRSLERLNRLSSYGSSAYEWW